MTLIKLRENLLSSFWGRAFLRTAAFCYGAAVKTILFAYQNNWLKAKSVPTRVVCIGNITTGGTGKTTAVMLAGRELSQKGVRVCVVSRGYKRQAKKNEVTVLFDQDLLSWQESGDEPYMISRLLAQYKVPVLVCAKRYLAAQKAVSEFKSQVILLDDGMQHHALKRDADIVLVDAKNPFGGGEMLPLGTLREPVCALKRASLIVLTHSDLVSVREKEEIKDKIRLINDEIEIIEAVHKPAYYFDVHKQEKIPLDQIKGSAVAFSAIGEPSSFEDTLRSLGLELKQIWRFPDHSKYDAQQLHTFAEARGSLPLITTFKDFVKMPEGWQEIIKDKFYILAIDMEFQDENAQDTFLRVLQPSLGNKIYKK
jgi:tetraacyldisaccharide 4'-kinase